MQNVNPQGKDCDDCVFRAIAGGTEISWKDTFAGLCQTGLSLHAMPDYPIVFRKYLKEIGARYVYKSAQAHAHTEDEASTADMTAGEFIRQHPKGNYVLRLWWHVTCARDGFLYDTWDASSEKLLEAWEIPPDIASAPHPSAPWLYERSERRLAPLEDIDVAAGQTFLFRNPSPVNRGSQDSFVRAIALAEGGHGKRLIRISAAKPSLSVTIRSLRPSRHSTSAAMLWELAAMLSKDRCL